MKRVIGSAAVIAFLLGGWACSSFDTATPPAVDGGSIVESGAVPDAAIIIDGNVAVLGADDAGFVVPLGKGGCASVTSNFCADFDTSTSPEQGWSSRNVQTGTATLTVADDAPSPSHYAEFALSDDEAKGAGNCAYDRLLLSRPVTFKRLTAQFDVLLETINAQTDAEAINFGVLDFHTLDNPQGETLYLGITSSHFFIHEQFGVENQTFPPIPLDLSRTSWVSLKETIDLTDETFTLEIKGQPEKTVTFKLSGSALETGVTDFDFGIGYSCAGHGGDMGFDDVVITYE